MNLTPMQYKDYVFPHNPKKYSISYRRAVSSDKVPYAHYFMQSTGMDYRVMSGEGEFVGEGAYDEFRKLATIFYSDGPGMLIHPIWQPVNAYFVSLELLQQPEQNYIAYRFEFWEDTRKHKGVVRTGSEPPSSPVSYVIVNAPSSTNSGGTSTSKGGASGDKSSSSTSSSSKTVTVGLDETLWEIADKHDTTVEKIMDDNRDIRNPNTVKHGQEVVIN